MFQFLRTYTQLALQNWTLLIRSIVSVLGLIFLFLESFEVLSNKDVELPYVYFLISTLSLSFIIFLIVGFLISGFLKRKIVIEIHGIETKINIKFGDIFSEHGWRAIAVGDFLDHEVDENLVSSSSLHGQALCKYWKGNIDDWRRQIDSSMGKRQHSEESRNGVGQTRRYEIGAVASAISGKEKFLFLVLGITNTTNNVTTSNLANLVKGIQHLLVEARKKCSGEPLVVPMLGTGLARVGLKSSATIDLIISLVMEESRQGKITDEISIIIPNSKSDKINLKNHETNWK